MMTRVKYHFCSFDLLFFMKLSRTDDFYKYLSKVLNCHFKVVDSVRFLRFYVKSVLYTNFSMMFSMLAKYFYD